MNCEELWVLYTQRVADRDSEKCNTPRSEQHVHNQQRGKQPKDPAADAWIDPMQHLHTEECVEPNSAITRKEGWMSATTWMNL